jgi:tRNA nucleotidyltransferase (CCA-adding enzyme)
MASMLAAQKLYPDALVVFPGSQEKNLKNFFIQSMVYLFNIVEVGKIDFSASHPIGFGGHQTEKPDRQTKPDTGKPRIGSSHLRPPPEKRRRYPSRRGTSHAYGSNRNHPVGIFLRKKKIPITPEEATIMCLGIYEDTGSFSFPSTTEHDFKAAAYLLSKGANLNVISSMITREFNPEQIGLLNDMVQASKRYTINGVKYRAYGCCHRQLFSGLFLSCPKTGQNGKYRCLFALALMENKVYVVARSRTEDVDVGDILDQLGGGGHPAAAAATIKGKTIAQTEQLLLEALSSKINSRYTARQLMSSPAIMAVKKRPARKPRIPFKPLQCQCAAGCENTSNAAGFTGYITRQVIEKALFHHLDSVEIREYMTTEISHVHPDAELEEIQDKIITNKQRILPVLEGERVLGVIHARIF